jgi:hypothetical protein
MDLFKQLFTETAWSICSGIPGAKLILDTVISMSTGAELPEFPEVILVDCIKYSPTPLKLG